MVTLSAPTQMPEALASASMLPSMTMRMSALSGSQGPLVLG